MIQLSVNTLEIDLLCSPIRSFTRRGFPFRGFCLPLSKTLGPFKAGLTNAYWLTIKFLPVIYFCSRDGALGIVTKQTRVSWFYSRHGQEISWVCTESRQPEVHSPSPQEAPEVAMLGVRLTTQVCAVPRLKMHEAIPPFHHISSWHGV